MRVLKEIFAVIFMSMRSLPWRLGSSAVIVVGTAGVVGVFISVLGMAKGLSETVLATGRLDRALVLSGGSNLEVMSSLGSDALIAVEEAPGVVKNADGKALATLDMVTTAVFVKPDGGKVSLNLRGMGERALEVRPEVKLIEGRWYQSGLNEIVVGSSAQDEFPALKLGAVMPIRGVDWTVVGVFQSSTILESALLTDVKTLMSANKRTEANAITVRLQSPGDISTLRATLDEHPAISFTVIPERDYYEAQSKNASAMIFLVTYIIGTIMAVGALFASLNTMYSAVSTRSREIATLRAIGYGATGVITSVFFEALLLALSGGVVGAILSWIFFSGTAVQTGNMASALVFRLNLTADIVIQGILFGCLVGFVGGLFPAVKAARSTVAAGLRTL